MRLLNAPGNVLVPGADVGLPKDSVANVTQVVTLDRDFLVERAGQSPDAAADPDSCRPAPGPRSVGAANAAGVGKRDSG